MLAITGFAVVIAGMQLLFPRPSTLRPLSRLPVPPITDIYLPGPLESPHVDTSVLGAETINTRDIITYINAERMKRKSPPLRVNATLTKAAELRAQVILKYQNFSHQDPYEHIQLDTVLPLVNYPFTYASENIGMGDTTAKAFVNGFMNSPPHKENLLNPKLQETGVALVTGPFKQYFVNIAVQIFAIPATREQYMGYSKRDMEEYKKLLGDIGGQLSLTRSFLAKDIPDKEYYETWEKLLIRQQEIVSIVYERMKTEQPLIKNFVTLIEEYNNNWNRAPRKST